MSLTDVNRMYVHKHALTSQFDVPVSRSKPLKLREMETFNTVESVNHPLSRDTPGKRGLTQI